MVPLRRAAVSVEAIRGGHLLECGLIFSRREEIEERDEGEIAPRKSASSMYTDGVRGWKREMSR